MDVPNVVIAGCELVGLVSLIGGVAYGYGAFRGRSNALAQQSKEATARAFSRIETMEQRVADLEKLAEKHEVQLSGLFDFRNR